MIAWLCQLFRRRRFKVGQRVTVRDDLGHPIFHSGRTGVITAYEDGLTYVLYCVSFGPKKRDSYNYFEHWLTEAE